MICNCVIAASGGFAAKACADTKEKISIEISFQ
jgi:hypothetical protein